MQRLARVLTFATLLVGSVACGSGAMEPERPAAPADVSEAARGMIEKWRQAYELRDATVLASLYAHDLDVSLTVDGTTAQGWTDVEAALKAKLAPASAIFVRLKNVTVVALPPDGVVATATMAREVQLGDGAQTLTEAGTLTLVLRRTNDTWEIVSEHYSYRRGA